MKPLQEIAILYTLYMLSERISWNSFAIQHAYHGINLMKHRNVQQTPKGCVHLANNYHLSALFSFYPQPIGPHSKSHARAAPEVLLCHQVLSPTSLLPWLWLAKLPRQWPFWRSWCFWRELFWATRWRYTWKNHGRYPNSLKLTFESTWKVVFVGR